MKTRNFNVPVNTMVEFAGIIGDNELEGVIIGVTDNDELEVAVDYEPEDSEAILNMIEFVENSEEVFDEDDN